ncbi:hypothetical protein [Streptomyces sp. NPDC006309]|uniref:hypothetical protein n=1 Tax=Streptomyces sp. NPDC006309 TaxID=3156749 RepID=UPI0033AAEA07
MPNPRPRDPNPQILGDVSDLTSGRKIIISAHSGGVLMPDDPNSDRHVAQAWRESIDKIGGFYEWEFTHTADGTYTIKNDKADRFLEPEREDGGKKPCNRIEWKTRVFLENGTVSGGKQEWVIRRLGDLYQFQLKGTDYVMGLRDRNNDDSHISLLDPWWSRDRLWLVLDADGWRR